MKTLVWSSGFKRSFKRSVRHKPDILPKIEQALKLLVEDPFHPLLHTHKLKGNLAVLGRAPWTSNTGLSLSSY